MLSELYRLVKKSKNIRCNYIIRHQFRCPFSYIINFDCAVTSAEVVNKIHEISAGHPRRFGF